jgi:preprotein translocase subunit YajC
VTFRVTAKAIKYDQKRNQTSNNFISNMKRNKDIQKSGGIKVEWQYSLERT